VLAPEYEASSAWMADHLTGGCRYPNKITITSRA
jgi:hypothetical protein